MMKECEKMVIYKGFCFFYFSVNNYFLFFYVLLEILFFISYMCWDNFL